MLGLARNDVDSLFKMSLQASVKEYTHRKINMEPENHLFEKENHLNQTFVTLGSKC